MSCSEVLSVSLDRLHCEKSDDGFRDMIQRRYFESYGQPMYTQPTHLRFASQVEQFTARDLSYETDSLKAFKGILNYYKNGQGPESFSIYTHFGLPLNIRKVSEIDAYADISQFVMSLSWEHRIERNRAPPKRRQGNPSFSWAGWAGVASIRDTSCIEDFEIMIRMHNDPETGSDLSALLGANLDLEGVIVKGQVRISEHHLHESPPTFSLMLKDGFGNYILLPNDFLSRHKYSGGSQIFSVDCLLLGGVKDTWYLMLIEY